MNQKVHFLGIAGSGASAVAAIAKSWGFEITGCDLNPFNEFTSQFEKEILMEGHSKNHLYTHPEARAPLGRKDLEELDSSQASPNQNDSLVDLLVITPAILSLDPSNEELKEAKDKGVPVLTWQEFLGKNLLKDKFVIAVCGTHGKTTTTALIGSLLEDAGLDPTVELGSIFPKWGKNFRVGKSKYFVLEADEFNDNFLSYPTDIAIVTNIDFDHPEFFKDLNAYRKSFIKFLSQVKKLIIANLSDLGVYEILGLHLEGGKQEQNDIFNLIKVIDYSATKIDLPLKIIGEYNFQNALATYNLGLSLGLDSTTIRNSLMKFMGVSRRQEYLGECNGAKIYSDFGHHPIEIKVTIEAFRKKFPGKRLVLIFQPHMFTRTKALFKEFVGVFQRLPADQVFIADIYKSREKDFGLVNSKQLVEAINKKTISYIGDINHAKDFIKLVIRKDDLVIFQGAGDIDNLARQLVKND
ncbi:UDP-N-acetylmuramate--L-alanine ligase [Candidatus Daviesbacteria bacterium]|nr:UDP-N-acetylmuramate--L-alanine ligase [Candidatus Daviesbacteria bacterium]